MAKSTLTIEQITSNVPDFGNGVYSTAMRHYFVLLQTLLGISPGAAKLIAKRIGDDAGRFNKGNTKFTVGAATKDGKARLKAITETKGVTLTDPLALVHVINWIETAGKHDISYAETDWVLVDRLKAYVLDMEKLAKAEPAATEQVVNA